MATRDVLRRRGQRLRYAQAPRSLDLKRHEQRVRRGVRPREPPAERPDDWRYRRVKNAERRRSRSKELRRAGARDNLPCEDEREHGARRRKPLPEGPGHSGGQSRPLEAEERRRESAGQKQRQPRTDEYRTEAIG